MKDRVDIDLDNYEAQQIAAEMAEARVKHLVPEIDREAVDEKLADIGLMWEAIGPDGVIFTREARGQEGLRKAREAEAKYEADLSAALIAEDYFKVGQMITDMARAYLSDPDAALEKALEQEQDQ